MVLVIIASALVNVGLGFALAMYAARRYQLLTAGNTVFSPGAEAAGMPAGSSGTADAGSVEGLQKKVEEFHQQLAEVEAMLGTK